MNEAFFKTLTKWGLGALSMTALVLLWAGGYRLALSALVGGLWMYANLFFLYQLIQMGLDPEKVRQKQGKNSIVLLSVLKFPVLYLAGFFILRTRFFMISGLVAGLSALFFVMLGAWFRTQASTKGLDKGVL